MNTTTGKIKRMNELMSELLTGNDMTKAEAEEELKIQEESGELMEIEENKLTEKQLRKHQVSLHDNRSHYGKKFTNFRREQRRINLQNRSQ